MGASTSCLNKHQSPHTIWDIKMAIVKIKNLALRTIIGFNPEEREKKQDLIINIELEIESSKGEESDQAADTVDYKAITKRIIEEVESSGYNLLEALARRLVEIISEFEGVYSTSIEIDKPHALRFSESVSVTISQNFCES